jgi:hypothetical protein
VQRFVEDETCCQAWVANLREPGAYPNQLAARGSREHRASVPADRISATVDKHQAFYQRRWLNSETIELASRCAAVGEPEVREDVGTPRARKSCESEGDAPSNALTSGEREVQHHRSIVAVTSGLKWSTQN